MVLVMSVAATEAASSVGNVTPPSVLSRRLKRSSAPKLLAQRTATRVLPIQVVEADGEVRARVGSAIVNGTSLTSASGSLSEVTLKSARVVGGPVTSQRKVPSDD